MKKNKKKKTDFLKEWILLSNGRQHLCRRHNNDYSLTKGEYIICKFLEELLRRMEQ